MCIGSEKGDLFERFQSNFGIFFYRISGIEIRYEFGVVMKNLRMCIRYKKILRNCVNEQMK